MACMTNVCSSVCMMLLLSRNIQCLKQITINLSESNKNSIQIYYLGLENEQVGKFVDCNIIDTFKIFFLGNYFVIYMLVINVINININIIINV